MFCFCCWTGIGDLWVTSLFLDWMNFLGTMVTAQRDWSPSQTCFHGPDRVKSGSLGASKTVPSISKPRATCDAGTVGRTGSSGEATLPSTPPVTELSQKSLSAGPRKLARTTRGATVFNTWWARPPCEIELPRVPWKRSSVSAWFPGLGDCVRFEKSLIPTWNSDAFQSLAAWESAVPFKLVSSRFSPVEPLLDWESYVGWTAIYRPTLFKIPWRMFHSFPVFVCWVGIGDLWVTSLFLDGMKYKYFCQGYSSGFDNNISYQPLPRWILGYNPNGI